MKDSSHTWEQAVVSLLENGEHEELVRACYYDQPLIGAADRFWKSPEWAATRGLLGEVTGSALDLGAGRGIASYALARDGWRVTALEPDPSSVVGADAIRGLAKLAHLDVRVVQERGESLPFPAASFDLAYARAVLHHARDLVGFAKEVSRVLRPGGRLVAVREHVVSSLRQLPSFLEGHPLHHLYGGENAFVLGAYMGALRSAGLQVETVIGPFASPINYAPRSREDLRDFVESAVRRVTGVVVAHAALRQDFVFDLILAVLNVVDRRPGRLNSFVARKPGTT